MDGIDDMRERELELPGNRLLPLDDPRSAWLVRSGRVAVFTLMLDGTRPVGPRQYRFDGTPGQALFGMPRYGEGARRTLVALTLEPTVLTPLPALTGGPAAALDQRLRDWIECWSRAIGSPLDPPPGDGARSRLDAFHADLAQRLIAAEADELRSDRERLGQADRASRQAVSAALGALASILDPARASAPGGPPLRAALGEVAAALGTPLAPAAEIAFEGSSLEQIEAMARASRLRHRKVLLHDGWWREDAGPILAFARADRRPLALVRRGRSYHLFDAERGSWQPVDGAGASTVAPEAFVFYPSLPDKAVNALPLLRFALRGRSRDLLQILGAGVGATLLGMLAPQAMALLVDEAIPDANGALVVELGIALVAAACGAGLFRLAQGFAMLRVETGADVVTQSAVWSRLLELEASFFRKYATGDLQSRADAVSQIRAHLGGTTLRSLFSSVILLLNLGLLFHYSPSLTLVALAVAAASGALTVASGASLLRYSRRILDLKGRFVGLMVQLLNGVAKLRVAAAEERAFTRWAADYGELVRLELGRQRVEDAIVGINMAISAASTIALFAVAGRAVGAPGEGMTTGVFLAFFVAYGTFIGAISSLCNAVVDGMAVQILRERARPILEARTECALGHGALAELSGRLELDGVSFQYREDGPRVIADVSLVVHPGEFVGLVGPSGSGKSTLFRLLLGFETPQAGRVFYDGRDLSGLDVHAVRRQLGVVMQGGRISAGSIFDNIAAGATVALNDAWEAVRAAGLAADIETMPMGLHTIISEGGTNLSGGQRQRLLLARSLARRMRILLLDEATSALDNRTQQIVSDCLERLDVTRVVIAHRLSTIRQADRIYVFEAGRVVQQGSFAELATVPGAFARLIARQRA